MILDHINNSSLYASQHPLFQKAFKFLKTVKETDFENGKTDIDGEKCFALFFNGEGKGEENILLEVHRKYIDIQFVYKGSDVMGYASLTDCKKIHTEYKTEEDYQLFDEIPSNKILVPKNFFTVFYPTDAHAPLIGKDKLLKVVVKIRIE